MLEDKNAWTKYKESRGETDCRIDETKNWMGWSRCAYSWECQGARLCQDNKYQQGDGWCVGDSLCPQLGPLDKWEEDGVTVKWNAGSPENYDGFHNVTSQGKIDQSLVIDLSEPKVNDADFEGIPGFSTNGSEKPKFGRDPTKTDR